MAESANDGLDKRGLTCAVVADKTVDVARHNVERVRNSYLRAILLGEVLDAQHGLTSPRPLGMELPVQGPVLLGPVREKPRTQ